ncbi:MAG: hypothetical protein HY706_13205 [Candidatus Hydrogenedentes bacterium]|nr:hypothetical protein [Candidatus Hydrogenedentota bacterium]
MYSLRRTGEKNLFHHLLSFVLCPLSFLIVFDGCAHLRTRTATSDKGADAALVSEITTALAASEANIKSVRAALSLTLTLPKEGKRHFPTGTFAYRRPSDLHVTGRLATGTIGFRIVCNAKEWWLDSPFDGERRHGQGKVHQNGIPRGLTAEAIRAFAGFSAPPASKARVISTQNAESDKRTVVLQYPAGRRMKYQIEVTGPPWQVTQIQLLDGKGKPIAVVKKRDYQEQDGASFPARIEAEFPAQPMSLLLELRNLRMNTELGDELFTLTDTEKSHEGKNHQSESH